MELAYYPDPVLKQKCQELPQIDERFSQTVKEMFQIMYRAAGIGLAAPQVGILQRFFILNTDGTPEGEIVCVDPVLVSAEGEELAEEGCLSFPGIMVKIPRHTKVKLRFLGIEGTQKEIAAEGLLARAIQHELDHLDGVLISMRMSPAEKLANRQKLRELEKAYREKSKRKVKTR
jgi:peptide deformylase